MGSLAKKRTFNQSNYRGKQIENKFYQTIIVNNTASFFDGMFPYVVL